MVEISRRTFLKLAVAPLLGAGAEGIVSPVVDGIQLVYDDVVGDPHSSFDSLRPPEPKCEVTSDNKVECAIPKPNYSWPEFYESIIKAPIAEECTFRVVPSYLLDRFERNPDAEKNIFIGNNETFAMSRREIILGIISSSLFGLNHLPLEYGVKPEGFPLTQTLGGFSLWFMQRKFGFFSNLALHMARNLRFFGYLSYF